MNEYARDRINGGDSLMLNLLRQCAGFLEVPRNLGDVRRNEFWNK